MKIAYLVFAYKNPQLIRRTMDHLAGEEAAFFVHLDAKVPLEPFAPLRGRNVFFTEPRLPVYWAEFSGVDAILLLMRQALQAPARYDYLVLLSGSEFPLRSRSYIHRFFADHAGEEFITMMKMPAPGKPISRLNTVRYPSPQPVRRFVFRALAKFGLAQRDYRRAFGALEPYSGTTWWALSRAACQHVIDFVDRDRTLADFCRKIHAPEETFIHTILGNSPFNARRRRNLVYEEWLPIGAQAHPEMISERHLKLFASVGAVEMRDLHGPGELLFARKFSDESLPLVDKLSALILHKERPSQPIPR